MSCPLSQPAARARLARGVLVRGRQVGVRVGGVRVQQGHLLVARDRLRRAALRAGAPASARVG